MKKSVFTLIAVLVLSTSTSFAQRYGGSRQDGGNSMQNVMSGRNGNRGGMNAGHHETRPAGVVRYTECRPAPIVHHVAPAPVPVVRYHHHPVPPVHVVHRPAPVYVEPVYVAPAPPPVVVHNSTAAGIVAGAVTVTALAALLCH